MDAMGHVNNTVYFRFMEEARVAWYDSLGANDRGPKLPPDCGPVVIHAACTFKRALVYPGSVRVALYVTEIGRASFTVRYEMRPSYDPDVIYAEGTSKGCWIDMKLSKSIPLPDVVRAALN
jgi:acyl-CoA thioester hydrolase